MLFSTFADVFRCLRGQFCGPNPSHVLERLLNWESSVLLVCVMFTENFPRDFYFSGCVRGHSHTEKSFPIDGVRCMTFTRRHSRNFWRNRGKTFVIASQQALKNVPEAREVARLVCYQRVDIFRVANRLECVEISLELRWYLRLASRWTWEQRSTSSPAPETLLHRFWFMRESAEEFLLRQTKTSRETCTFLISAI